MIGGTTIALTIRNQPAFGHVFYYATARFCCAILTRAYAFKGSTKLTRLDNVPGIILPTAQGRDQTAGLTTGVLSALKE